MNRPITIIGLEYPVILVEHPEPGQLQKWGELAYLTPEDRMKVLALGYGKFEPACECLRKALKKVEKETKKKNERW